MERRKMKTRNVVSPPYAIQTSRPDGVGNTGYVNFFFATTAILYYLLLSATVVNSGKKPILFIILRNIHLVK